jgi:hypothetical protein
MSSKVRVSLALCLAAALIAVPFARGATSNVVVSQVFAGGGNSGAPFTNDFVELFNRSSSPVSVTGWSVQYASATSTSWQTTPLTGTIQPGKYFLVQLASAAAVGAPPPAPDATGTTNLAASGGKVALVRDANALACGATAGSCASAASIEDFVGYGTAADWEGAAAVDALSNTTAAVRAAGGCTDTNANAADFTVAAPVPRNSASAGGTCSAGTPTSSVTGSAAVDVDLQPVLSIALERPTISFGRVFSGDTPAPISERITVVSTGAGGYSLTAHRTAFAPADLPLAIAASSTAPLLPIPVPPTADLVVASTSSASTATGDVWPANVGFASPLPSLPPGHYTSTLTFTVIAR